MVNTHLYLKLDITLSILKMLNVGQECSQQVVEDVYHRSMNGQFHSPFNFSTVTAHPHQYTYVGANYAFHDLGKYQKTKTDDDG